MVICVEGLLSARPHARGCGDPAHEVKEAMAGQGSEMRPEEASAEGGGRGMACLVWKEQ